MAPPPIAKSPEASVETLPAPTPASPLIADPEVSEVQDKTETETADATVDVPMSVEEKKKAARRALRPFAIISSSYLLFTVTDGAARTIVLMHAYSQGFSVMQVALMFTLYELAGVFTNLFAGLAGAKWGLRATLITGLCLQLFAYSLLFGWDTEWDQVTAIAYVTVAQAFGGIAKDLTKLGGKVVTKLVTPEEKQTSLFKLVSFLTGMKNSLKALGYFLGSALVSVNYELALGSMMALVVLALPAVVFLLDKNLGTAKAKNASLRDIFTFSNHNLNYLSFARAFLFASRDFWFEVPLPFYLRSPSCVGLGNAPCIEDSDCSPGAICDVGASVCANFNVGGGCGGLGYDRVLVGTFLAGYIIVYGQMQTWTPQLVTGPLGQTPPNKLTELLWGSINIIPTVVAALVFTFAPSFVDTSRDGMTVWVVAILFAFAIIFAINSSVHSYLVVKYAKKDKVAVSVGLYYMSNAMGRLFGTLGSGLLFSQVGDYLGPMAGTESTTGMVMCFTAGSICSFLAVFITKFIHDSSTGLRCGRCVCKDNNDVSKDNSDVCKVNNDAAAPTKL